MYKKITPYNLYLFQSRIANKHFFCVGKFRSLNLFFVLERLFCFGVLQRIAPDGTETEEVVEFGALYQVLTHICKK